MFFNIIFFRRKEVYLLDHVEERSGISFEMHEKNEVIKSEILDEVVDVSPGNCYVFSLHGSFEYQFDSVQGNLQLRHPSHGKKMIEFFEGCHVFL